MAKKKKYPDQENKSQDGDMVNEPSMNYISAPGKNLFETFKTITVSSLEEQEEDMRKYSVSLSPLQRMAYLYQLNQIAFASVLNDPNENLWEKKIIIDKYYDHIP